MAWETAICCHCCIPSPPGHGLGPVGRFQVFFRASRLLESAGAVSGPMKLEGLCSWNVFFVCILFNDGYLMYNHLWTSTHHRASVVTLRPRAIHRSKPGLVFEVPQCGGGVHESWRWGGFELGKVCIFYTQKHRCTQICVYINTFESTNAHVDRYTDTKWY